MSDGMIMTLFKLLDVSRRGVLNWSEFERLPSLLLSISLKPSHPGDPLPPPGIIEVPPIANPMSSMVRPLRLSLPRVEEGCLSEGTTWARLGLDIEDDISLATRSMSRRQEKTQFKHHRTLQRFGKHEDAFTGNPRDVSIGPKTSASPMATTAALASGKRHFEDLAALEYMRIASVDESVNAWLRTGRPPLL
ncbi:hypothetical protein FOL47_005152 [Perkinsus chesapeaki]|uniref:Uncharacterized protein n=1 Tax=Perkinsus chesapeaki TaxID=330153 RepID=A0A7J6LZZ6_PERCH|nr:hypothetical protein FOL47_005152 [Perkinsus chesapeaki]